MSDAPFEVAVEGGFPVELPSGGTIYVLTDKEREWLESNIQRYFEDNHFKNVTDLLDIDKLVSFELLVFRWNLWLGRGEDYFGDDIVPKDLADTAKSLSIEIRQLKHQLGLDKLTRDRLTGDDSVSARWANILERAKEFGYKRNEEAAKAIESMHRVAALITYYENLDEHERRQFHMEIDDLIEVIKEEVAEFRQIDDEFRANRQRYWIKSQ